MKKIFQLNYLLLTLSMIACTSNFEEMNTDPRATTSISPDLLFTGALRSGTLNWDLYQIGQNLHADFYCQYFANNAPGFQTDRLETNPGWLATFWNNYYSNFIINTQEAIRLASPDPRAVNKVAQARIWRAWLFHRLTDYWGDVPYSQAGQGVNGSQTPEYDTQESIYRDMIEELREAAAQLDPTQPARYGAADILYNDNLERWRRFANSLRLRLALRMSNADPAAAQTEVRALMTENRFLASNADNAQMVTFTTGQFINRNPLAILFNFNEFRVSKTMVDLLTELNDPRLPVYAAPVPNSNPPRYAGLPNGLNAVQLGQPANARENFSQPGPPIRAEGAPIPVLMFDEVCFLQAEAVQRGWGTGDARALYEAGIRANFQRRGLTDAQATAYLAQPSVQYNGTIERIITQKWIALYPNGFEGWAELRRTGFPALQPWANPGETNGLMPARVRYPPSEQSLNQANYEAAVARQGPDLPTTRLWWARR
ncbi:MAG: SusD/RagB family nutrient-binding outer membrane lipoprotein [Bernardetiaceae bacterium]|nr:SusD/RagB family nutrient-binding outer membrane lipoprotein [Bernardetiaceae bacterium]